MISIYPFIQAQFILVYSSLTVCVSLHASPFTQHHGSSIHSSTLWRIFLEHIQHIIKHWQMITIKKGLNTVGLNGYSHNIFWSTSGVFSQGTNKLLFIQMCQFTSLRDASVNTQPTLFLFLTQIYLFAHILDVVHLWKIFTMIKLQCHYDLYNDTLGWPR